MTRVLVTFATKDLDPERDALVASARGSAQFDDIVVWTEEDLRRHPAFEATSLLDNARGFGFWSWKPRIILDALNAVDDGDVVVYSDVGRYRGGFTLECDIAPLLDFCAGHDGMLPGVLAPNFGANARWTRRDCFVLMGCDEQRYWDYPQVQATFSVWIKSPLSVEFVSEWSEHCMDLRIVGDGPNTCGLPNLPGFVDHRHDQSILTNLVLKRNVTPFVVAGAFFRAVTAIRPHSLSANLVVKNIDNVTQVASGVNPVRLFAREWLRPRSRVGGRPSEGEAKGAATSPIDES